MKQLYASKPVCALLLAVVLCGIFAPVAHADGMVIPSTPDIGFAQVDYHHVKVSIDGIHASTSVEQRFSNPYSEALEGRYFFPIPPGASIRNFSVQLDGKFVEVEKMSSAEAEAHLRQAITDLLDPSLLQYFGWDTYVINLTLPPFGSTNMLLEYSETLYSQGDLYRYFYTLGTERYSAGPLPEVSIEVDLRTDEAVAAVYSPGHIITTERLSSQHIRVTHHAENVLPTEHFELFYTITDQPFGAGMLTHPDPERSGEGHFMLILSPSSNMNAADAAPKDIVFILDRSGSMAGEKIEQAKQALQFILGQLNERDRFAIVSFDDLIESQSEALQAVTSISIQHARSYVSTIYDRGYTDIDGAIRRGLEMLKTRSTRPEATPIIIFLTDGLPTTGITDEDTIVDRVRRENEVVGASIHVFGVGYDVNTHLLDHIASQNHGAVTYVQPGESLEVALTTFYDQIAHPLLTDLELSFEGMTIEDVYPRELPDLFVGSSLTLVGRYSEIEFNGVTVWLQGRIAGEAWSKDYRFASAEIGANPFIPRLWATRRIGELLDQIRVSGEQTKLVEEIEVLGIRYGIVTPYTADIVYTQTSGAASDAYMSLYSQDLDNDGQLDLNKVSGAATVGARAQNLAYQQTAQAGLAVGSNVVNIGEKSTAQVGQFVFDLNLVDDLDLHALMAADETWLSHNVDRIIRFASAEYFELAKDTTANQFLQAGPNVIFEYKGEMIVVQVDSLPTQPEPIGVKMDFWSWLWTMLERLFLLH